MKVTQLSTGYVVRLELGEELVQSLYEFTEQHAIEGAWVSGLGGATKAQLGYYNLERKKYIFRHVKDVRELVSVQGNIAWIGEKPALHLHGVVTDSNNRARGGHLKELVVGGTCEIFIQPVGKKLTRAVDPQTELPLLDL